MHCRHCARELALDFVDLGTAPPSNAFLAPERLAASEIHHPLRVKACTACWLVQTLDYARPEDLFDAGYAYFSSFSSTWLAHVAAHAESVIGRYGLGPRSLVVEIASNDGVQLEQFQRRGIPCLGFEPTASTAAVARGRGLEIVQDFFGEASAQALLQSRGAADLIVAENVLAHVPDINDFVRGVALLLSPEGVATFEFPHLVRLVDHAQFDTIYHEHYSYLSLAAAERVLPAAGLAVFDVEELPVHGGSLRLHVQRRGGPHAEEQGLHAMRELEDSRGVTTEAYYAGLQARAERIKDDLLFFLIEARRRGERVAGYGAAAKGNTLLNFAGVRSDLLHFVADRNPAKQGKYLPGSRIPVVNEQRLRDERPEWVLVLPWNLIDEVRRQLRYVEGWGGRLVTAVPELTVHSPAPG